MQYFFVYTEPTTTPGNRQEEQIEDAYELNSRVARIQPNQRGELEISLSIRVAGLSAFLTNNRQSSSMNTFINVTGSFMVSSGFTGRKAYGDWEIAEVLKIFLDKKGTSYQDITSFDISELSSGTHLLFYLSGGYLFLTIECLFSLP